jgi:hypothetical protein
MTGNFALSTVFIKKEDKKESRKIFFLTGKWRTVISIPLIGPLENWFDGGTHLVLAFLVSLLTNHLAIHVDIYKMIGLKKYICI